MRIFILLLLPFFLTACVTQDQMDVKMSKGCAAGVNSLIENSGREVKEIKVINFSNEQAEGGLHRRVQFGAIEKEGWLELEKEYSCLFVQEWSVFKLGHKALLVQVKIDEELYGKKDGTILGSFDDFLNLTKVTDGAMNQ